MDITFNRVPKHKGFEMELIVEDDIITTAKVYVAGKCVNTYDIYDGADKELPYTRKNLNEVYRMVCDNLNPNPEPSAAMTRAE